MKLSELLPPPCKIERSPSHNTLFRLLLLIFLMQIFTWAQNFNSNAPLHRRRNLRRLPSKSRMPGPDVVRQMRIEGGELQYKTQKSPDRQGTTRQQEQENLGLIVPQSLWRFAFQNQRRIRAMNPNLQRDLRQSKRTKSPFSRMREHRNVLSLSHSYAELSRRESEQKSHKGNVTESTGQKFQRRLLVRLNNSIVRKGNGQKLRYRERKEHSQPSITKQHQNRSRPVHLSTLSSSMAHIVDVNNDKSQVLQINEIPKLAPNNMGENKYGLSQTADYSQEQYVEKTLDGKRVHLRLPDDSVHEEDASEYAMRQERIQMSGKAGEMPKDKSGARLHQTGGHPLFSSQDRSPLRAEAPPQHPQQEGNGELAHPHQAIMRPLQVSKRSPETASTSTPHVAQHQHRANWQRQIPYSRRSTNINPSGGKRDWNSLGVIRKRKANESYPHVTFHRTSQPAFQSGRILRDCDPRTCRPPGCLCPSYSHPGNFSVHRVPMIVMLTFDDAITSWNFPYYQRIMRQGFRNPNGCPIQITFFVCDDGNNDYSLTGRLHAFGHEIASHSQTHRFPESWWAYSATKRDYVHEFVGQRRKFRRLAGIPISEVKGLRAPFLSTNGNIMIEMAKKYRFLYDSSCVAEHQIGYGSHPIWPYTLDHPPNSAMCEQETRPTQSFPGVWEVPLAKYSCNDRIENSKGNWMLDECRGRMGNTSDDVVNFLWRHFSHHYPTRAPMGLFTHATFLRDEPEAMSGLLAFLHGLTAMEDVWLVSVSQMLDWMKSPTPTDQLFSLQSWSCS